MKLTYTIDQLIAIEIDGGYFDLHNDYKLVSALPNGDKYYLRFEKRVDAWVKASDPSCVSLVFEEVTHTQASEGLQMPTSIEEIGFKEPDDFDTDWFMERPEVESADILFRLEDDQWIRIGATNSFLLIA